MEVFEILLIIYVSALIVGTFLEKFRIPWIFSVMFLGMLFPLFAVHISEIDFFRILADLGMYFLLFIVGFEMNIREMKRVGRNIMFSTFFIILFECICGTLFLYFGFGYPLWTSFLVSLSFATVGEGILIPILDELRMLRSRLGTYLVGIGTLDDVIEVLVLFAIILFIGGAISWTSVFSLPLLFILTLSAWWIKKHIPVRIVKIRTIKYHLIAVGLSVFFLFVFIGSFSDAEALGALLSGIFLANVLPKRVLSEIENEIKILAYGFFSPIFFFWIGYQTELGYIFLAPLLTVAVFLVSNAAKIIGTYFSTRNVLGQDSWILGVGLCVRFSTSLVIIQMLLEKGFIDSALFSALIASAALSTVIIPLIFPHLLRKKKG